MTDAPSPTGSDVPVTVEQARYRMLARVADSDFSGDCPFCAERQCTGHTQFVPMCRLCELESERDSLRSIAATVEQANREWSAIHAAIGSPAIAPGESLAEKVRDFHQRCLLAEAGWEQAREIGEALTKERDAVAEDHRAIARNCESWQKAHGEAKAERDALRARLAEAEQRLAVKGDDPIYVNMVEGTRMLEAAGMGKPGKPNTHLAMIKEACAALAQAEARAVAAEQAAVGLHGLAVALSDENFTPCLRLRYREIANEIKAKLAAQPPAEPGGAS